MKCFILDPDLWNTLHRVKISVVQTAEMSEEVSLHALLVLLAVGLVVDVVVHQHLTTHIPQQLNLSGTGAVHFTHRSLDRLHQTCGQPMDRLGRLLVDTPGYSQIHIRVHFWQIIHIHNIRI